MTAPVVRAVDGPSAFAPVPERLCVGELAGQVLAEAGAAIAVRARFTVALAGGSTPYPLYREVERAGAASGSARWDDWTVLLTDERCLPAGDSGRNDAAIADSLPSLARAGRVRPIPVELGPPEAAQAYDRVLEEVGPIDLAVLGLGADGHTAGVFPGDEVRERAGRCRAVEDAPEPFRLRVTLDLETLCAARQVWFVVDADDRAKDAAVERLLQGEGVAAGVAGREATRLVLLEHDAADVGSRAARR